MGAISGLVGLGGGQSGTGVAGPQQAPITNPTNAGQIAGAYNGTQASMQSQQQLLSALQGQNGLGNQSQVYGQLQGIASGAVNPAQAQFAQNTAANVSNQAALMAGQRGASQNAGLIARQAAQQGAATQQQAVGQEATQQANNQIAAIGQAGQLATTQAGQQIGQVNANTQAQQAEQANLLNAQQGFNSNQVSSQNSVNAANAGLAQTTMQGQQGLIGGVLNGAGAATGLANGGPVMMAAGGSPGAQSMFGQFLSNASAGSGPTSVSTNMVGPNAGAASLKGGVSSLGQKKSSVPTEDGVAGTNSVNAFTSGQQDTTNAADFGPQMPAAGSGSAGLLEAMATGGKVKALVSPGEKYLPPQEVNKVKQGANPMAVGKTVPGKPKVGGAKNSYANDTVPATLEEGGIVLPRSITMSKNPGKEASKFVQDILAKRKR